MIQRCFETGYGTASLAHVTHPEATGVSVDIATVATHGRVTAGTLREGAHHVYLTPCWLIQVQGDIFLGTMSCGSCCVGSVQRSSS